MDAEHIRALRAASNEAIAQHDIEKLSRFWRDDMVIVRGDSTQLIGKDAIVAAWRQMFAKNPEVRYVRTPVDIIISHDKQLVWETGKWQAFHSYSAGGNYSAMWKNGEAGWQLQAELFVSLL